MANTPMPLEIRLAERKSDVRSIISEQEKLLDQKQESSEQYGTNLELVMNAAYNAEIEAMENKKKVNDWWKANHGDYYYETPLKLQDRGYHSFIYKSPEHGAFFHDTIGIPNEVINWMLENEKLEYYGKIEFLHQLHHAWTTPRNIKLLRLNSN